MSSDKTTLDDFRDIGDARDGGNQHNDLPDRVDFTDHGHEFERDLEKDKKHCQSCGTKLTEKLRGVFGDEHGIVQDCPHCSSFSDMTNEL